MTLKKYGLRLKPPAIIIYYETSSGSLRKCIMPVRNFRKNSNIDTVAEQFKQRHSKVLNNVPKYRIEKLFRILQECFKGIPLDQSVEKIQKEFSLDSDEDLNKVDENVLKRKKELMNETFITSQKSPGDPDYMYDVEKDFDVVVGEASGWDSDLEI